MANYNLLSAIQPPQVVGQLPVLPNQQDQAAGGIMQGLAQGQDIAASRQNMAAQQQQMQQNAALFPAKLQNDQAVASQNQTKAESDKIDLSNKKTAQAYAINLRNAAAQSEEAYVKALMPEDRVNYQMAKAKLQTENSSAAKNFGDANKANADANKTNAEATGLKLTNAETITHAQAMIYHAALQGQNPQQQQQIYQQGIQNLATQGAPSSILKTFPQNFDQQTATAAMILDQQNKADAIERKIGTQDQTSEQKNTNYINGLMNDVKNAKTPEDKAAAQQKLSIGLKTIKDGNGIFNRIFDSLSGGDKQLFTPSAAPSAVSSSPSANLQTTPTFQENQVYKDAKGNQAKYVGGKWVEIK